MANARIGRGLYKCNGCGDIFGPKFITVDHISPVVPIGVEFNWDTYINNLFCDPSGLQCLCCVCHDIKTRKEQACRKDTETAQAVEDQGF